MYSLWNGHFKGYGHVWPIFRQRRLFSNYSMGGRNSIIPSLPLGEPREIAELKIAAGNSTSQYTDSMCVYMCVYIYIYIYKSYMYIYIYIRSSDVACIPAYWQICNIYTYMICIQKMTMYACIHLIYHDSMSRLAEKFFHLWENFSAQVGLLALSENRVSPMPRVSHIFFGPYDGAHLPFGHPKIHSWWLNSPCRLRQIPHKKSTCVGI